MVGKMKEFWGGYREPLPSEKGGTLRVYRVLMNR